jgi:hypothetical protein
MPHPLQGTCFNCGASIDTSPAAEDQYAIYSSEVEYFSSRGLLERSSVVRRLVCTTCAEFAELHPVRFPSPGAEA